MANLLCSPGSPRGKSTSGNGERTSSSASSRRAPVGAGMVDRCDGRARRFFQLARAETDRCCARQPVRRAPSTIASPTTASRPCAGSRSLPGTIAGTCPIGASPVPRGRFYDRPGRLIADQHRPGAEVQRRRGGRAAEHGIRRWKPARDRPPVRTVPALDEAAEGVARRVAAGAARRIGDFPIARAPPVTAAPPPPAVIVATPLVREVASGTIMSAASTPAARSRFGRACRARSSASISATARSCARASCSSPSIRAPSTRRWPRRAPMRRERPSALALARGRSRPRDAADRRSRPCRRAKSIALRAKVQAAQAALAAAEARVRRARSMSSSPRSARRSPAASPTAGSMPATSSQGGDGDRQARC